MIHTHDLAVIPFGLPDMPLRPVVVQAGFLPKETPLFEVRDANASGRRPSAACWCSTPFSAMRWRKSSATNPVVLMRGHGETVVGRSVQEATVRTIYTHIDARAQAARWR